MPDSPSLRAGLLFLGLLALGVALLALPPALAQDPPPEPPAPADPPPVAPPVEGGVEGGVVEDAPASTLSADRPKPLSPAEAEAMDLALPEGYAWAGELEICDVHAFVDARGALTELDVPRCAPGYVAAIQQAAASWSLPSCEQERCEVQLAVAFDEASASWSDPALLVHWSEVKVKRQVQPKFPKAAKELGIEGQCRMRFFIDKRGVPYDIRFEDCPVIFQQSALEAGMQWRFYPMKVHGEPVRSQFVLNIRYVLR